MFVSDITVSHKCDRAAMYTILVNLKSEEDATQLAEALESEISPEGSRTELFVWIPSDSPTVLDAYTFERSTAEKAHAFLSAMSSESKSKAA